MAPNVAPLESDQAPKEVRFVVVFEQNKRLSSERTRAEMLMSWVEAPVGTAIVWLKCR